MVVPITFTVDAGANSGDLAVDEGEYLPGTRCVAVPLLDDGAGLIAALSGHRPIESHR